MTVDEGTAESPKEPENSEKKIDLSKGFKGLQKKRTTKFVDMDDGKQESQPDDEWADNTFSIGRLQQDLDDNDAVKSAWWDADTPTYDEKKNVDIDETPCAASKETAESI